jgi:predicted exporter
VSVNGDEVVVRQGDQIVTLEERLAAMQRSIRRLTWLVAALVVLAVLNAVLGPERFWELVGQAVEVVT